MPTAPSRGSSPKPGGTLIGPSWLRSELVGELARHAFEYSVRLYLDRQKSSPPSVMPSSSRRDRSATVPSPSPRHRSRASPESRHRSSGGGDGDRGNEAASELVGHLLRGAAALAARQFVRAREKRKLKRREEEKEKQRLAAAAAAAAATGAGVGFVASNAPRPEGHPHRRHRERRQREREQERERERLANASSPKAAGRGVRSGDRAELVTALDGLSDELQAASVRIRKLTRRPPRHAPCEVYDGLTATADGLQTSISNLRTGVNNIRNLQGETLSAGPGTRGWAPSEVPMVGEGKKERRKERSVGVGGSEGREARDGEKVKKRHRRRHTTDGEHRHRPSNRHHHRHHDYNRDWDRDWDRDWNRDWSRQWGQDWDQDWDRNRYGHDRGRRRERTFLADDNKSSRGRKTERPDSIWHRMGFGG